MRTVMHTRINKVMSPFEKNIDAYFIIYICQHKYFILIRKLFIKNIILHVKYQQVLFCINVACFLHYQQINRK